jgi:hypothetical protein
MGRRRLEDLQTEVRSRRSTRRWPREGLQFRSRVCDYRSIEDMYTYRRAHSFQFTYQYKHCIHQIIFHSL